MRIKILGKVWDLFFRFPGKNHWGYCELDQPNKKIVISKELQGKQKLEIILHELFHAANPHHEEVWVDQLGKDISHILWRLGYRHKDEIYNDQPED